MRIKIAVNFMTRSAIADSTARRVWNVKRASFLLSVGAFRSKFYGNGVFIIVLYCIVLYSIVRLQFVKLLLNLWLI